MTTETKRNLIFLAILLPLMLPGGIILFIKKLDPNERKMYLPDPVRTSVPYMDPIPSPAQLQRTVPPKAARWVASLAGEGGVPVQFGEASRMLPVMSEKLGAQLLSYERIGAGARLVVLLWNPSLAGPLSVQSGTRVEVVNQTPHDMPKEIWRELQDFGYTLPPTLVTVVEMSAPEMPEGRVDILLSGNGHDDRLVFEPAAMTMR